MRKWILIIAVLVALSGAGCLILIGMITGADKAASEAAGYAAQAEMIKEETIRIEAEANAYVKKSEQDELVAQAMFDRFIIALVIGILMFVVLMLLWIIWWLVKNERKDEAHDS